MKRFMPVFLFPLALSLPAGAQVRWGIRAGVANGSAMIGADVHYDIEISRDAAFRAGTGIALIIPERTGPHRRSQPAGRHRDARRPVHLLYAAQRTVPTGDGGFNTLAVGIRF
jgi:hypothetical protein